MSAGFCPQSQPDSCVAACCAMLLHHHHLHEEPLEAIHDRLHATFSPPVRPGLSDAVPLIGAAYESLDADDDNSFARLQMYVTQTWCAVVVLGGPWTHDLLCNRRKLRGPHGRLSTDPNSALPRHAVVLTAWGPTSISVYDPWFDMFSQPVRAEAAWLRRAWTGELAYFPANPWERGARHHAP